MSLTIQGDKSLEGKKWKLADPPVEFYGNINRTLAILEQIQDDEIKVGDRVVFVVLGSFLMTKEMIYRAHDVNEENIWIIDNEGDRSFYPKSYFTKLQKPKEGDGWWLLQTYGEISRETWNNNDFSNRAWDFGFGFHSKEQAEFCRDRVRRVI